VKRKWWKTHAENALFDLPVEFVYACIFVYIYKKPIKII